MPAGSPQSPKLLRFDDMKDMTFSVAGLLDFLYVPSRWMRTTPSGTLNRSGQGPSSVASDSDTESLAMTSNHQLPAGILPVPAAARQEKKSK